MNSINYQWIMIAFFFLILITIQYTLNKIVVLLNEIIRVLKIKN